VSFKKQHENQREWALKPAEMMKPQSYIIRRGFGLFRFDN
jgi:hypothetical protein